MPKNTKKARERAAAQLAADAASRDVGNTGPQENPPEPAGGAIQFNVDQLFAAYGAKNFEVELLRAENQRLQQQVVTLKNYIRAQEGIAGVEAGG